MLKERKSEQTKQANGRPVIFQNVQFQNLHIFPFVIPCFQSWTQWANFFVKFWWVNIFHTLRTIWEENVPFYCTRLLFYLLRTCFINYIGFGNVLSVPLYLSAFLVLALWSLRPPWVLGTLKSPSLGLSCSHQMDAAGLTTHSHLLPLTSPTTRYNNIPMPTP